MPTALKTTSVKFEDKVYEVNYLVDVWIVAEKTVCVLTVRGVDNEIPTLTQDTTPSILDDENAQNNLVHKLVVDFLKIK
jgi:hypothetical protein